VPFFVSRVFIGVHVLANVVWVGALLSVALLVSRAAAASGPRVDEVGTLARLVHVRLAVPAFVTSFTAGLAAIFLVPGAAGIYATLPWFHAKLTFALVVIVLHHVIGARARRVAGGDAAAARGVGRLGAVAFVASAAAVLLGVVKSLP
jgi:putative membrane protein